ncbi:PTS sugar transporter subunit IIA [Bacillus massilinigeriensis]|uniref:PTS sugar transporter subunit IIA n=1 Tax=Bacillus massilionigeriensis TaxID=1805475 RepID=UPI000BE94C9A|nr:PTS glucose transporter subunit IIA [Bacillus massilionigeriensis]
MAFHFFKKPKLQIFAPVNGAVMSLEEVPDPVFSQRMMGEGVAMVPKEGNIFAPVQGKIIQIAPTNHAIGILADDGSEILIHIGLDTVNLKGKGFTVRVKEGDQVSVGQLLMEVDWEYLRENDKSIITPIVITNSLDSNKRYEIGDEKEGIVGETVIMTASGK